MFPNNKSKNVVSLIGICVVSSMSQLLAEEINWSRVDGYNNVDTPTFTSAVSGQFDTSDTVYLFHSGNTGDFYDSPDGPETNVDFNGGTNRMYAGGYVSSAYTFDHLFTDANLPIFNAWQTNDYKVEIFGGDGTISASGVTMGHNDDHDLGIEGVDYQIFGEGTSSITLDAMGGSTPNAQSFYGSLQVTGTFSGIKFSQIYDQDREQFHGGSSTPSTYTDEITRTRITGITSADEIVPEPSSTLLLGMSSTILLLRRKRN